MSIIDKIVEKSKSPKPLGRADREHLRVQEELKRQNQQRADRARLAALEARQAAIDVEHAAEQREAYLRRDRPSRTQLAIFDANQAVELQQRVIARTNPAAVQLNDGSMGTHPAVGKLLRLKAALKVAIDTHERVQQSLATPIYGSGTAQSNAADYLKGRG